ncbi:MAG TPA: outer membrane beta-barrel protein [Gemmatimonadales bacterium]
MRTGILSLLSIMMLSLPAMAQEEPARRGFWVGFGLGGGANLTTTLDDGSPGGFAGSFRAGGTLNQKWLLGGESIGWVRDVEEETWAYRSNFSPIAMFYPSATGGWFLKAGPSISVLNESSAISNQVDGVDIVTTVSATEIGFGGTFGVGYDLKIGRNLYLVPEVNYLLQAFSGRVTDTPLGTIPGTNSILVFTLGLTWH